MGRSRIDGEEGIVHTAPVGSRTDSTGKRHPHAYIFATSFNSGSVARS